jgi:hypothetical protein
MREYEVVCAYANPDIHPEITSPGYLHIHTIACDQLVSDENRLYAEGAAEEVLTSPPLICSQWGTMGQLYRSQRSAVVDHQTVKTAGDFAIGSAAKGSQIIGDFEGGGEAIMVNGQSFRIARGRAAHHREGVVHRIDNHDRYWTVQVADFSNVQAVADLNGLYFSSREHLLDILKMAGKIPTGSAFIATFRASFQELWARSNGGFRSDNIDIPTLALFRGDRANGGHVVGDSQEAGDMQSLHHNGVDPASARLKGKFISPLRIRPIHISVCNQEIANA